MSGSSILAIMLPAFFECLVLVGIHSYLGIHVIKRKVIFVDLALAQIAALGSLIAFLFGVPLHSSGALVFSIGLTAVGAAIFSLSRFRKSKIPQEAVIGLVYAVSAATAVLIIDKAPQHGAEHIQEILTGSILWVKWKTVGIAAAVYAVVGAFHYVFRDRFILISENPDRAWDEGLPVRLWDFLFYLSFGIVITLSVSTAGVLLVFVFLVAPAIIAIMLTNRWAAQLLIGWGLGLVVTTTGLFASYFGDLPTGTAVIGVYGATMILVSTVHFVARSAEPRRAALHAAAVAAGFTAVALVFLGGGMLLGEYGSGPHAHENHNASYADQGSDSNKGIEHAGLSKTAKSKSIRERFEEEHEPLEKMKLACMALDEDPDVGAAMALEFLASDPPPFFRAELVSKMEEVFGETTGLDPFADFDAPKNRKAAEKLRRRFEIPEEPGGAGDG